MSRGLISICVIAALVSSPTFALTSVADRAIGGQVLPPVCEYVEPDPVDCRLTNPNCTSGVVFYATVGMDKNGPLHGTGNLVQPPNNCVGVGCGVLDTEETDDDGC